MRYLYYVYGRTSSDGHVQVYMFMCSNDVLVNLCVHELNILSHNYYYQRYMNLQSCITKIISLRIVTNRLSQVIPLTLLL